MTTYGAVHRRASTYGDVCRLTSTFVHAECVDVRHRTQCERGFRTTRTRLFKWLSLRSRSTLLHRLPNARPVGRHAWCNLMTIWWEKPTTKLCIFLVYMYYTVRTLATRPLFLVKIVRIIFEFLRYTMYLVQHLSVKWVVFCECHCHSCSRLCLHWLALTTTTDDIPIWIEL